MEVHKTKPHAAAAACALRCRTQFHASGCFLSMQLLAPRCRAKKRSVFQQNDARGTFGRIGEREVSTCSGCSCTGLGSVTAKLQLFKEARAKMKDSQFFCRLLLRTTVPRAPSLACVFAGLQWSFSRWVLALAWLCIMTVLNPGRKYLSCNQVV